MQAIVRSEARADRAGIRSLNEAAFGRPDEADLVDALRRQAVPVIALVAELGGAIVGHIMFSPVSLRGDGRVNGPGIVGLAPMAVSPERQRQGIGSKLVRDGIHRCRRSGFGAVVVLGHPEYYPRFGFSPAADFGIGCEYDVPAGAFMALELYPGALDGQSGTVQYPPSFASV